MLFYFSGGLITICATIACMSESFQTKFLWTYGLLCLYCLYKVRTLFCPCPKKQDELITGFVNIELFSRI